MANATKYYKAKSVKIGLVENSNGDFYIDIIGTDGNQQTIASGNYKYVKSFIGKIIFI
jgi:hypothetical protein